MKAPIHAMLLTADMLGRSVAKSAGSEQPAQERYIVVLKEELSRFKRTLEDMLTGVAPSRASFRRVDICELVRDLARLIALEASAHDVEVKLRAPEDQAFVDGHPDQLKQALLNLMLNALDAMRSGGRLGATVEKVNKLVEIKVSDTGAGVDEATRAQMFELHFTTKAERNRNRSLRRSLGR